MAAADLFHLKDYRKLVFPVGIIILFISMMISGSFVEQIEEGDVLLVTVFLFFGILLPTFLLAAAVVRKRFGSNP
jgi:spore germination protein KB